MTPAFLSELHLHMEWADALVWKSAIAAQPDSVDSQLFDTLAHLHSTQKVHLILWQGERFSWREFSAQVARLTSMTELQQWSAEYYCPAREFVSRLTPDMLKTEFVLPWAESMSKQLGGPPAVTTLGESLYQVAAHSTYHRGQVNRRIRELGGEPPLVDYIAWAWLGKPAPSRS